MQKIENYIDQTLLSPEATTKEVTEFCNQAKKYGFYAVCVQPTMVKTAAESLHESNTKVAAVVGFPCGSTFTEVKKLEAQKCIEAGATEIDMVINQGALKEGKFELVKSDIKSLSEVTKNKALLKVIIETGHLTDEEKIIACKIAAEAGADFVKTSTGAVKTSKPATVEDVKLMVNTVKEYGLLVKASGGIKNKKTAVELIKAGASRLGTSSGVEIITGEEGTYTY